MGRRRVYKKGEKLNENSELTFIREVEPSYDKRGQGIRRAMFLCSCGREKEMRVSRVKVGTAVKCGYCRHEDLAGQRFSRLVATRKMPEKNTCGATLWECLCDCGSSTVTTSGNLKSGHTRSCGCYLSDSWTRKDGCDGRTKEGTYTIWLGMRQRCTDPKSTSYGAYGGRGISVCSEWEDYRQFHLDMGDRPEGMSIERLDNSKGYSADNCVWADNSSQSFNRRRLPSNKTGRTGVSIESVDAEGCLLTRHPSGAKGRLTT